MNLEDGRNQNGRIVMFVLRDEITDVIVKATCSFMTDFPLFDSGT